LPEEKNSKEDEPRKGHGVPEPCGCVDGDLAGFNALEMGEGDEAEDKREHAEKKVEGVQAGDDIEEIACGSGPAIEGESLGGELAPCDDLAAKEHESQRECGADPGKGAAQGWPAEAEPFLEDVKFAKDVAAAQLHGEGAQEQDHGIEEEDARQENWVPIADLLHGARVKVHGGLARVKDGDESQKERHVAGEGNEDECACAVEDIARATARTTPIVISPATTSAGRPAGDGWFAPDAGGFAFDLRRDGSKDRGHGRPCEDEFTLTFVLTHRKSEEVPAEWEKKVGIEGSRGWREISGIFMSWVAGQRVQYIDAKGFEVFDISGYNNKAVNSRRCRDHRIFGQIAGLAMNKPRPLAKDSCIQWNDSVRGENFIEKSFDFDCLFWIL